MLNEYEILTYVLAADVALLALAGLCYVIDAWLFRRMLARMRRARLQE